SARPNPSRALPPRHSHNPPLDTEAADRLKLHSLPYKAMVGAERPKFHSLPHKVMVGAERHKLQSRPRNPGGNSKHLFNRPKPDRPLRQAPTLNPPKLRGLAFQFPHHRVWSSRCSRVLRA